jgi:hypothetical protein
MRLRIALSLLIAGALCMPSASGTSFADGNASDGVQRLPVSALKIMNYFPANAGWSNMWTDYSHDRTIADFRAISSLGANTVRIIVPPAAMGYPEVSPDRLAEFQDALAAAQQAGLQVQLTLFDMWHNYGDIAGSQAWVQSLLTGQSGNPTIALVELQNEIPLTSSAFDWARRLLPYLSTQLPGVPRTVSAAGATGDAGIKALLGALPASLMDVADVHYYGDAAGALDPIRTALAYSGNRPVIVGEAGLSTIDGSAGEQAQARFYGVLARITQSLGVPAAAPWIFSDFTANAIPYRTSQSQYHFGLRLLSGEWKPAAAVVSDAFAGRSAPDIDGGFEREANGDSALGSWTLFDAADGKASVTTQVAYTGRQAVCFAHTSGHLQFVPSVMQSLPVLQRGQVVSASAYVLRWKATGFERVALAWFDARGRFLGQFQSPLATTDGAWTPVTVSAQAPAAATTVQVHLKAAYENGYTCYDDVSINW